VVWGRAMGWREAKRQGMVAKLDCRPSELLSAGASANVS
jgi:hypothetical protein